MKDRPTPSVAGRKVTVVGLGRFGGGVGVTRWLCGQGARVTVSDRAKADDLADSLAALEGLDVALHLGGHERADFLDADLLVVNPAVPPESPLLVEAARAGIERTTEINLFLERCRAPVAGVTGTVGKSTTTVMSGAVVATVRPTHVGGNIGGSLLEKLDEIEPEDAVVLELSSFQLEALPQVGISPGVALVTNLAPNHLDRHGTMDAYAAAKRNIYHYQDADGVLVLNAACEATARWADDAPGRVEWFDPAADPFALSVPGAHNQANAQAAWAVGRCFGVERSAAAAALQAFTGLPHRLAFVGQRCGVRYYNDSKCTTPEGAVVALEAFEPGRAVILLGGYDKGVAFDTLAAVAGERAKAVVCLGATAERIARALSAAGAAEKTHHAADLPDAVRLAGDLADPGDVVLLSPACASYDLFTNYEQRGDHFTELVAALPE